MKLEKKRLLNLNEYFLTYIRYFINFFLYIMPVQFNLNKVKNTKTNRSRFEIINPKNKKKI